MLPVLELHLTGKSTPEMQAALSEHVPTCSECLAATEAIAEQPATLDDLPPDELPTPPNGTPQPVAAPAPAAEEELLPSPVRALVELIVFGIIGVVVAVATLITPDFFAVEPPGTDRQIAAGITVSEVRMYRVRPDGTQLPLAGAVIGPKDRLAFGYLHTSNWERVMVFVVDEKGEIYWQVPEWTDRREPAFAPTILNDRNLQVLPPAVHRDWIGKTLSVHTMFTKDFVTTREVEEKLTDPARDKTKPLFDGTAERITVVTVDPDAASVTPPTQDETDPFGTEAQDRHLRIEPIR